MNNVSYKILLTGKIALTAVFLLLCCYGKAQLIPLNKQVQDNLDILLQDAEKPLFTGYRAVNWLEWSGSDPDGIKENGDSLFGLYRVNTDATFKNRILNGHWLQAGAGTDNFLLTADPYLNAGLGLANDPHDRYLPATGIGVNVQAVLRHKLSFGLTAYTSSTDFPAYVDEYIAQESKVVPGEYKAVGDNRRHYRYTHFSGYLSYVPDEHIALTAGYGKIFIGDGYRSLLLSDNAAPFPYLRLKASYWKLTYNVIYARYASTFIREGKPQPKFNVMHYLGINIGKRFQFGFFESVLWMGKNGDYNRGIDVQYLNPLLLLRPVEFSLGSTDNALMGSTAKYTFKNGYLYAQLGLDDFNLGASLKHKSQDIANKYFFQLGIWKHHFLHLPDLDWRLEWNAVRPYTYSHKNTEPNYGQRHQALADPFGANFHEFISILYYNHRRWYGRMENLFAIRGENPGLPYNNGEDIWGGMEGAPEFGSTTLQGIRYHYFYNRISFGWYINPRNRLALQGDLTYRLRSAKTGRQSAFIFALGIQTNLFNHYYDW